MSKFTELVTDNLGKRLLNDMPEDRKDASIKLTAYALDFMDESQQEKVIHTLNSGEFDEEYGSLYLVGQQTASFLEMTLHGVKRGGQRYANALLRCSGQDPLFKNILDNYTKP